jgi:tetratricopeptide (TPR) repeat protein
MVNEMTSFVERYQLLYEKDPNSKVFAPLAEAYRRMGLLDEAIDLARRGVEQHPNFASGRVALGKCYVQKAMFSEASEQLKVASDLSPENLLAHQLLAECYSRLRRPIEAMAAYKIVLFLNPNDSRVAELVQKLEGEIYGGQNEDDDLEAANEEYSMGPIKEVATPLTNIEASTDTLQPVDTNRELEQDLALIDARYRSGDFEKVKEQLEELALKYPDHPEIVGREHYLGQLSSQNYTETEWIEPAKIDFKSERMERLKSLLSLIEARGSRA